MRLTHLVRSLATVALVAGFVTARADADALWATAKGEQLILIERAGGQAIGMWLEAGGAGGHLLEGSVGGGRVAMVADDGRFSLTASYRPNQMQGVITVVGAPANTGPTFAARLMLSTPSLSSNGLWVDRDGGCRLVFVSTVAPASALVIELAELNGRMVVTDVMQGTASMQSPAQGKLQVASVRRPVVLSMSWNGATARGQIATPLGVRELRSERIE